VELLTSVIAQHGREDLHIKFTPPSARSSLRYSCAQRPLPALFKVDPSDHEKGLCFAVPALLYSVSSCPLNHTAEFSRPLPNSSPLVSTSLTCGFACLWCPRLVQVFSFCAFFGAAVGHCFFNSFFGIASRRVREGFPDHFMSSVISFLIICLLPPSFSFCL